MYRVKTIVTSSGERLPILLGRDGLPIFEPTIFSLTDVRRASNTIDSYLRSVMVLLLFLDLRKINLAERLIVGQLLSLGEIEDLVGICRFPLGKIHSLFNREQVESKPFATSVVSLESVRRRPSVQTEDRIDGNSAANRLRNIRDYLKWLCLSRISKHEIDASLRLLLESSMQNTYNAIEARMPSPYRHLGIKQREGLDVKLHPKLTHLS
jgi:hypothetical protein